MTLERFLDALGDVLFNVAVWTLRAFLLLLVAKLGLRLLGMQDALLATLQGLWFMFVKGD